jgi:DNA mismatch repair protein MutS2
LIRVGIYVLIDEAGVLYGSSVRLTESGIDSGGNEAIAEGDRVKIRSLDRVGTVETIRDDTYTVMVGALRYRAERGDLERTGGSPSPVSTRAANLPAADTSETAAAELKVIGLTADEALERVDKFLDQAFLAGIENVRIIHGHGKGILRKAIAKFLTDHTQVERYSLAPPEKGGSGATIVELKK